MRPDQALSVSRHLPATNPVPTSPLRLLSRRPRKGEHHGTDRPAGVQGLARAQGSGRTAAAASTPFGETHCIGCGGELDDKTDETATCVSCLAVQFGHDQAQEVLGMAACRRRGLIAGGDHQAIGGAIGEIAAHTVEIVDAYSRPPRPARATPRESARQPPRRVTARLVGEVLPGRLDVGVAHTPHGLAWVGGADSVGAEGVAQVWKRSLRRPARRSAAL